MPTGASRCLVGDYPKGYNGAYAAGRTGHICYSAANVGKEVRDDEPAISRGVYGVVGGQFSGNSEKK